MSLSLVSEGPQPPFNEPQTKCQSKRSLVQGQGSRSPKAQGRGRGQLQARLHSDSCPDPTSADTGAEGDCLDLAEPWPGSGGSPDAYPRSGCCSARVLMMAPASSIIFRARSLRAHCRPRWRHPAA